jgi:hypothetical protein
MNGLRTKISFSLLFLATALLYGYGGGGNGGGGGNEIQAPTNLVINAQLVGQDDSQPFGDGSGTVVLTYSATNATRYKINFGDGEDVVDTNSTSRTYTYIGVGTKDFTIIVSAYNGDLFVSGSVQIRIKINSNLVWSDEFNGSGAPNSANWTHEIGGHGWGNGEFQYYTNRLENSRVEGGVLKITAKRENYEGKEYTSARLITKDKYEFKYGRVDIKAKLPEGAGTWPALWMLGANFSEVGWPDCGEIDIMEHWGHIPTKVSSATHTRHCSSLNCSTMKVGETTIDDYSTAFHVYSLEWEADRLNFLIDDNFLYSYNPSTKTSENWPFDKPFFFILNVAMGSNWHTVDPAFESSTMEIDYIRVFQ